MNLAKITTRRWLVLSSFLILIAAGSCAESAAQRNLLKLVNPFVGTAEHGHTYPGATVPFGMVQLSPDTRTEGWDACAGYHYSDSTIMGFSHTHLSGTGVADYGDILVMPTVGKLTIKSPDPAHGVSGFGSRFRHSEESASPGYYRVRLEDCNVKAELTATRRVGLHRYTFPRADSAGIIIDLSHGLGADKVIESSMHIVGDHEIEGFRRSEGWAKDQVVYFVAELSKPFKTFGIASDEVVHFQKRAASGKNLKGIVRFSTHPDEEVILKVGLSAVSIAGARRNLRSEAPGWDFNNIRVAAEKMWNEELNRVWVDGGDEGQRRTFYTALYHSMVTPNVFSDVDGQYRGMDGKIHTAEGFEMYTVFSLWDTFRAEHPLFTILDQKRALDFVRSLLAKYEESGILPVWELAANETWCMIGYHSVPVILDAYVKGIRGFDAQRALVAMEHSAQLDHYGLKAYREFGYIPAEVESESVSKTLEYAYDDWCISQFAGLIGKKKVENEFAERGQFYRSLFDPATGFMRAKENGRWFAPFDPTAVTFNYTEANSWQYSFFAPQDIQGLVGLLGGRDATVRKLDELFSASMQTSGRSQVDISGMIGQYAQGNEPSHHVAYLYDDAGAPWHTQAIVRRIVDSLYSDRPDGLCGNDDCGQMSAWYVFSAMGFYPVTPGLPMYSLGSPLFDRVTIHLKDGKQFVINAGNNSRNNKFIQAAALNGAAYERTYLNHADIMRGGSLDFVMGPQPNEKWGSSSDAAFPAGQQANVLVPPVVDAASDVFADSLIVRLVSSSPGAAISYSISNGNVQTSYRVYDRPITLKETSRISAYAEAIGFRRSRTTKAVFTKFTPPGKIDLHTPYSSQYSAGGDLALVDGKRGNTDFRLGAWQGYEGNDLDAVIDLGSVKTLSRAALGCLQDNNSWIFFPTSVVFSFSSDGSKYSDSVVVGNTVNQRDEAIQIRDFSCDKLHVKVRYVRVHATNVGVCPDWHKGAGSKAWLFVDEITLVTR